MNRCFVLLALLEIAGARLAEGQPVIRADVNLVQVSMRVTDAEGHSVPGLKKEDFELFVDEVRLPISQFQNEDAPVTAGIIVDNSASMGSKRDEVIAAAMAFARASNRRDQMFVVHFNEQAKFGLPESMPYTSKVDELQTAISKMEVGGTTALYDAIGLARTRFRGAAYGRKVLLVITDGGDTVSKIDFNEAVRAAEESEAIVYSVIIVPIEPVSSPSRASTWRGPRIIARSDRSISAGSVRRSRNVSTSSSEGLGPGCAVHSSISGSW